MPFASSDRRRATVRSLVGSVVCCAGLLSGTADAASGAVAAAVAGVVGIQVSDGVGTGFITSAGVVTAAHVVDGSEQVTVSFRDDDHDGRVIAVHPRMDLALIEVSLPDAAELALDVDPELGEPVTVVTFDPGAGPVLTRGIISALPAEAGVRLLQIDAAVNFGSSGGPVLGDDGRVLGVVIEKDLSRDDAGRAHRAEDLVVFFEAGPDSYTVWPEEQPVLAETPGLPPAVPIGIGGAVALLMTFGLVRSRMARSRDDLKITLGPAKPVPDREVYP